MRHSAKFLGSVLLCASAMGVSCRERDFQRANECPATCDDCSAGIACGTRNSKGVDSRYCPLGTTCDASGAVGAANICKPYFFPDVPAEALIDGFRVGELLLVRDPVTAGQFTFDTPSDTRFVSCGLFIAAPKFEAMDRAPLEQMGAMVNSGACIARSRVFRIDDSSNKQAQAPALRLDELRAPEELCAGALNGSPLPNAPNYPVVESLHLGCWAMSDDRVLAASTLLSISPAELPDFSETPLDSCDQSQNQTDGAYCYVQPLPGACDADACKPGTETTTEATMAASPGASGAAGAPGETPVARTQDCRGQKKGTPCLAKPSALVGRCFAGGCVDQQVAIEPPLVVADCTSDGNANWLNCFPSPLGTIGTCYDGVCRVRCHGDDDCETAQQFLPASSNNDYCVPDTTPGRYLSVCTEPP